MQIIKWANSFIKCQPDMSSVMKLHLSAVAIVMFFATSVDAGKGGTSSSSSSRPSFGGGSSSSRPSFGGGSNVSKPSMPSFGGGSSTKSTPSFGGGSSTKSALPSTSKPTTPTFSGGSSSSKSGTPSTPAFGGGSSVKTTTPIPGKTPVSVSKKPVADSFDKLSATQAKQAESRKAYEKSEAPAVSYTAPSGKQVKVDPNNKETSYLRGRLDESRWQSRSTRSDGFYGSYYNRPLVVYNDHFNPYWNYWLASQTIDVMSMWIYHHQMQMDQDRLNAMYANNADLRARVAALERQRVVRDQTYTPKGVDPDLMYSEEYVNAVYNPRPKTVDEYEYGSGSSWSWSGFWTIVLWIFVYIPLTILAVFVLYYFIFEHRW